MPAVPAVCGFVHRRGSTSGLEESGAPACDTVGDHPANDTFPAAEAGLRTAHIRRGPWGHLWGDDDRVRATAEWVIQSLVELTDIAGK
ncbi:hypothetical protein A3Q37_05063 [Streptomyces sp. PTY087I2]|nr:hypothetical protein A3Q37_05063 [Streptomyces sp. PTY087I2]